MFVGENLFFLGTYFVLYMAKIEGHGEKKSCYEINLSRMYWSWFVGDFLRALMSV